MNFRGERSRRPQSALEMTPLIDVVFLLLVFFLLTTTFSRPTPAQPPPPEESEEAAIEVDLAQAASGTSPQDTAPVSVYLDEKGLIYLDGSTPIAPNALKQKLLDRGADAPIVNLKADKGATHGAVIELFDLIKETGVETVNIIIEKRD